MRNMYVVVIILLTATLLSACGGGGTPTPGFDLTVQPGSRSVAQGGSTTVTVTITRTGDFTGAVQLSLEGPDGVVGDGASQISGSFTPNPATAASTLTVNVGDEVPPNTYTLTVRGTSGSLTPKTATFTVTVGSASGDPPTIESFSANPVTVEPGGSSTLSWSVTNATSVSINQGIGAVDATGSALVSPTVQTTYTLTASNDAGSVTATATVNVEAVVTGGKVGNVFLAESSSAGMNGFAFVNGVGSFIETNQSVPGDGNFLAPLLDTCFVLTDEGPGPIDPLPDFEGRSLDAGDPLTVNANGSVYATLTRQTSEVEGETLYSYITDFMNPPAPPLPDTGLTLDIPGAEDGFPAFAGVALPSVAAFALTGPEDTTAITTGTTFTWSGGANGTNIAVVLFGSGEVGEAETVSFACYARDDGSFTFPADTQAALNEAGFTTGSLVSAGRLASSSQTQGDALLNLVTARLVNYGFPGGPESEEGEF